MMNKGHFVSYMAEKNNCTKTEAERVIDMFTNSVISALGEGNEIALIGFGSYKISEVAERSGRNPRTGEVIKIKSYKQPRFKVGQKMKDACN